MHVHACSCSRSVCERRGKTNQFTPPNTSHTELPTTPSIDDIESRLSTRLAAPRSPPLAASRCRSRACAAHAAPAIIVIFDSTKYLEVRPPQGRYYNKPVTFHGLFGNGVGNGCSACRTLRRVISKRRTCSRSLSCARSQRRSCRLSRSSFAARLAARHHTTMMLTMAGLRRPAAAS